MKALFMVDRMCFAGLLASEDRSGAISCLLARMVKILPFL